MSMEQNSIRKFTGRKVQTLSKAIFQADVPEQMVLELPAQSLYMAICHNGLPSSLDVIEMASLEQCRILLDLDLWKKDLINEENFWNWLALPEVANDLSVLQKILKCIDLKIIALILARYVEVETFEEPTDLPPSEKHYTPDKGTTWVRINLEDPDQHFLLARLLALIFETNTELYYQLISVPAVASESSLEEESYQDKRNRLQNEGIPDLEGAAAYNSPLDLNSALALINKGAGQLPVQDITIVEPLCYESASIEPLSSFLAQIKNREEVEAALTITTNSAIVHFGVDFSDQDKVLELIASIKGALNVGIEILLEQKITDPQTIYSALGIQGIYRLGLGTLFQLRKLARQRRKSLADDAEPWLLAICDAIGQSFPVSPTFIQEDGTLLEVEGKLAPGNKPIDTLSFCRALKKCLGS